MIDSFTYFNETDLFFLRVEYLSPYVDHFVIVELDTTFSLLQHNQMFSRVYKQLPEDIKRKIVYEFINVESSIRDYNGEAGDVEFKNQSRNIDHIMRNSKARLIKQIGHPSEYMFMSDIDEIWDVSKLYQAKHLIDQHAKMGWMQDMRSAFIDWRNPVAQWVGTKGTTVGWLPEENVTGNFYMSKGKCVGHYADKTLVGGWHLTMMGNQQAKAEAIAAKRETPGWEKKLNLTSDEIASGMMNNKFNSVVKKGKMRVEKVEPCAGLTEEFYKIAKRFPNLWSGDLTP